MVILLADPFLPDLPERLRKFGTVSEDMADIGKANILIVRSKTKVTKEIIDKAPNLQFIIRGGVGVDTIDVAYAESKKIEVTNTPEASSLAVAELAFALMIAMPNHIVEADTSIKQGKWLKKELERTELHGKVLGLIGIGRIAREVAIRARAFGMKVIAYDKYVQSSDVAEMVSLETVYKQSDYISLHTPLTDETKGMINADAIVQMKQGVFIINTCRGQVIIEEAVAKALESGKIAGYAADVFYAEPPENSPLLKAPHTIFTPHIGASTEENLARLGDCIVDRISKFVSK